MNVSDIRQRFELEIEKSKDKILRYKEMTGPVAPDNAIGRVSRMDAINNKGVMDAALRKAEECLKGLERHLDKLDSPDFGLCVKCGAKIPLERIFMAPQSSFCVNCARK